MDKLGICRHFFYFETSRTCYTNIIFLNLKVFYISKEIGLDNRHTQYFPLSLSTRSQFTCSYNISMSKCLFESNFFLKKESFNINNQSVKEKEGETETNKMKLKTAIQLTYFFILFLIFRITFVTVFKGHFYRSMHNTKYI